jgi:hypothetical protein
MDPRPSFLSSKNDQSANLEQEQEYQSPPVTYQHYAPPQKEDPIEKLKNNPLVLGLLVGIVIGIILTNMRPVIINPK